MNRFDEDIPIEHLCLTCGRIYGKDIAGTTTDSNNCDFARDYREKKPLGFETVDNGMGYLIVSCPNYYYSRDFYQEYINSKQWKEKRKKRIELDNFNCQICGTAKNLQVHHITYDRLYNEDMNDLVTLCKDCHKKIHENDLKGGANG